MRDEKWKKHEDEELKEIYRKRYEKLLQQKEGEEEEEKNSEEISERIKKSRGEETSYHKNGK